MYLVYDIGGTSVKYAWMTEEAEITEKGSFPTEKGSAEQFYGSLTEILEGHRAEGIALSYPGVVDSEKGIAVNAAALPFLNGHAAAEELGKRTSLPVSLENDGKCAALAEMWKGSLAGCESGLLMVLGTGIGGAVILNGKLYRGAHCKAGEFGSFLTHFDHDSLTADSLGSSHSAVRMVKQASELLGIENDGRKVFSLIEAGDERVMPLFLHYCYDLAAVIFNIDYVLDLDRIAVGGGISVQPVFIDTLRKCFLDLRSRYRDDSHDPEICACRYHNDANLIGALYHHLNLCR